MWAEYKGVPQELNLPHAPKQFIHVYTEKDAPDQPLKLRLPVKSTAVWLFHADV